MVHFGQAEIKMGVVTELRHAVHIQIKPHQ
jgi:hypothetical protein